MGYKIDKGFIWVLNEEARALPSEYQEVEWIQSSGTQYIDTGYIITPNTEVSADFQFTSTSSQAMVFGIGQDSNTSSGINFNVYIAGASVWSAGLSDGTTSSSWNNTSVSANTNRNKFVLDNGTFKIYDSGGTLINTTNTNTTISRNATHSFGIFARRETYYSAFRNFSSGKLYGLQIKDNGTLTQDFVPCYRKSDDVIGLYDLVNSTFYTNAGTGTFTKGGDIDRFVEKQFYPGAGGGYKPNANTLLYLPLDGDYLDKSSNHNDGTAVGTMSFGQIGDRQYASFGASSAIQLGTIPVGTGNPQPFTQSVWLKTTASGVGYMHHFGVDSYHSRSCLITFYSPNHIPLQDLYGSSYDTYIGNATTSDLWNKWINLVYTYDNGTHKLYINGELRGTASNTINIGGTTNRYIGRIDANNGGYCMAECIFESVVWSAQEALDYYNLTKSDFGL